MLSYGEDPESLSHLGLVYHRVVTDGRTDRIPIANTRSQQYLPIQLWRVKMSCAGWWRGGLDSVQSGPRPRDVYLGGTCGQSSWRDDVAVPILLYVSSLRSIKLADFVCQ